MPITQEVMLEGLVQLKAVTPTSIHRNRCIVLANALNLSTEVSRNIALDIEFHPPPRVEKAQDSFNPLRA